MTEPVDPRVRRTRGMLTDAVLTLAADHDFADITVREIADRADVNRNTFYLHFRDKQDLIDQTLDRLFDELTAEIRKYVEAHQRPQSDETPVPMLDMLEQFSLRPRLYLRLLQHPGPSGFPARLRQFNEQEFLAVWNNMHLTIVPGSMPPGLRASLSAMTFESALVWWLETGLQTDHAMLAGWIWSFNRSLFFEDSVSKQE